MMKLDKRKTMIIGGASGIGFIFLFFIFVRPLFVKIHSMRKELRSISQELNSARNIIKSTDDLEEKGHVLAREEISLAIDEITKKGKALNINIISISPQEIEGLEGSSYQRLPIHMDLESEYKDTGLFFGAMERLKQSIVTLRSFAIQRDEDILPLMKSKVVLDIYVEGESGER